MSASVIATTKGGSASSVSTAAVLSSASTQVGDLLLVVINLRGSRQGAVMSTVPSGCAQLQNPSTIGDAGAGEFPSGAGTGTNGAAQTYWFVATAAGAQTYTFGWSGGAVDSWLCHTIRGQASGTPVELLGSGQATTATSLTTSGVTTTEGAELIIRHVFGNLASGATAMTGSGLVWDAATAKIADIQGAGASGLEFMSASGETGPTPAAAITGRSITLPSAPISTGTVMVGVKAASVGSAPPSNTAVPVITTDGSPETGETVTTDTGTWTNSPTGYAYQWKRNGTDIAGATSSSYVLQVADVSTTLTVTVTATNSLGSVSATSAGVTPAAAAPVPPPTNTVAPFISTDGTPAVGEVVTAGVGTWANSPTGYTYQWLRNGVSIAGATASTHTIVGADVGTGVLSCSVTATNSGGSATVNTPAISPVLTPGNYPINWYRLV